MNRKKYSPPSVHLERNTKKDPDPFANYSYASIEFRPMKITDDGAVSTAVESNDRNKLAGDITYDSLDQTEVDYSDQTTEQYNYSMERQINDSEVSRSDIGGDDYDSDPIHVRQRDDSKQYYDSVAPMRKDSADYSGSVVHPPQQSQDQIQDIYAKIDYSKKKKKSTRGVDAETRHQNGDSTGDVTGTSKFFVDIPEKRGDKPPLAPKPYKGIRKQSAPAISIQKDVPQSLMGRRCTTGKKYSSSDDLNCRGNYYEPDAPLDENYDRNSSNERRGRRSSSEITCQTSRDNNASLLPPSDKNSFKKHRRMRSHENVTKIFSTSSPKGSQSNLNDLSPESGKSSMEESSSDSATKESPDDSGENMYDVPDCDDVKEILRKAEELVSDELPEGWQEVRDGSETYYWHIWTGTIQYERPVFTPTTSSSSRSLSPLSSSIDSGSSKSTSVGDLHDRASQSKSPLQASRAESPPDKPKQAISFPVHSMGWLDVTEDKMGPTQLGETINNCISSLAEQRKDLWKIGETWGEGRDIKLLLEGEVLKLVEPKTRKILLQQPIAKMRVWGVGREDQRDFAYIARDKETAKHRCHMFRCHGNVSGRSITNALQTICNRVLDEKRRVKERSASPSQRSGSDLLNAPLTTSTRVGTGFNEKPFLEQKKSFSAKYVGWTEVAKSSGIDMLNKAVSKLTPSKSEEDWKTVLIEVTTSEVRTIDCLTQDIIMEDRVRFVSFLGIAKDERMCGYIVAAGLDMFVCHVYYCVPHGGALTRAIEEACRLRFEKVLDKHAPEGVKSPDQNQPDQNQANQQKSSAKEKGTLKSSMQGLFNKLQKKETKKKDDVTLHPNATEHMIKYFGCVKVELGTGIDTVQGAVEQLMGGSMMVGYLEVTETSVHLSDSQRTALSRRVIDMDTVSYCGMTSDRKHFGLIVSQGRGKYVCHVFQEYKTHVGTIVSAIHDVL